ncbi:MAG: hypothetical protein JST92_01210 [Deltaproteobacteria bacterium]|nr:hypothetical protein [Deltaproteobacteria bacterium]
MSTETASAPAHDSHGHGHDVVMPDATPVNVKYVAMVGIISVALFGVGAAWALKIQAATEKAMNPTGPAPIPAALHNEENGIVDYVPFELNKWKENDAEVAREKLTSYAWVDKKAGVVRVPIERAMELVIAEQDKAEKAPAPAAPQGNDKKDEKKDTKKPEPKKAEPKSKGGK